MHVKIKKILGLLLSFALIAGMSAFPMAVKAYEPAVLSVSHAAGSENTDVTVTVNISAGSGLAAADLFLTYDNTKLAYAGGAAGAAAADGLTSVQPQPAGGGISAVAFGFAAEAGITGGGSLFAVTFTVIPGWSGITPLVLTTGDFFNDSYQPVALTAVNNGSVAVPAEVNLTVGSAAGQAGMDVPISVGISAMSRLAAADLYLKFDHTKLSYKSGLAGAVTAGGIASVNPQTPQGNFTLIKLGFAIEDGLSAGGSILDLVFTVKPGWSGVAPLELSAGDFYDEHYLPLIPVIENGKITVAAAQSTITFDTDGGSPIAPIIQVEATPVVSPPDPVKAGFVFAGWVPAVPAYMPADDVTCVAQWQIITYYLNLDANGGTGSMPAPATDSEGRVTVPFNAFTRTGCTFVGWNTLPDGTGAFIEEGIKLLLSGDMTLYAQWTANPNPTSTISFDTAGGTPVAPVTQDEGTPVVSPPDPVKAGYIFMGWVPDVPEIMPEDDITCVARWEQIPNPTSKIYFDLRGGRWPGGFEPPYPLTQEEGTVIIGPPVDPVRDGYTFMGWTPAIPATMPADDITVAAQWSLNNYRISFDANGGQGSLVQDVSHGGMPAAPVVTRVNYIFAGWTPEIIPADRDEVYTAQWIMLGDTDLDGTITSIDALMALQAAVGLIVLPENQKLRADVDFNGKMNPVDALKILQFAGRLITVF